MEIPYDQPHEKHSSSVVVVIIPFLAQSHLNQLLQLAQVVSSYDIPVHYVASALHNSQVKSRASNTTLHHSTKIQFHDFPIPALHSPPPNPYSKTKFPEHLIPCFEASTRLREPVTALLQTLSTTAKRLVVIHDVAVASVVQEVVSLPNAEAYSFSCYSAFFILASTPETLWRNEIFRMNDLPSLESCFPSVIREFIDSQLQTMKFQAGEIHNTSRAIEGSFLELLANDNTGGEKKIWAVGPLHQTTVSEEPRDSDKWLLEWLNKQEPNSVLYISFGTTTTFSNEEIKELALGLEESGVKFIWVLRDADKVNIFSDEEGRRPELPDGFEERMNGMGIVVREWVPQVKILGHPSTGGFMSHCGWNSCLESISMGVPIATWPMHSDQPYNALLIMKLLKVGVAVMEWGQRDELVSSSMINRAVRKLMASEEGDEIRKRAKEMGDAVKRSAVEGGGCRLEWDSFIAHITG
ncbi:UDP-glucuronosyl/UDP-glucosyltransferase [Parasponia andersonii]|uniref:Glycosyltransferase n=1 Tax=Parasponia andersonii TaxID=3476 RepID=A0A2P5BYR0_PARAD|nr:UDP-glucuronosyl/UDP-glucosyltransferase [Parasponia andersonii]